MTEQLAKIYQQVEDHARSNSYVNTINALALIKKRMSGKNSPAIDQRMQTTNLHSMEVCKMLIDLHIDLAAEEEDVLLASVILHIYLENYHRMNLKDMLEDEFEFSHQVYEIIELLTLEYNLSYEEQMAYYDRIQRHKLALLAILAYRGNTIQHLYEYTTWNAHRFIDETKACYYPMCIYGKEHYHELLAPISVLMGKIKTLLEVAEILIRKYEVREIELMQDILDLKEENATIRGIIHKFQNEQE